MTRARVYRSAKREFDCKILESGEIVKAKALGNLLKGKSSIVVGDYVSLEKSPEGEAYEIHEVEDRSSEVFRMIIREQKKKVTAANCDLMVILMSVSKPAFKRGLIDRYLVRAAQWQIRPIVIFNKMDQYDESFDLQFEEERLKLLGVSCFEISALDPDYKPRYLDKGYDELVEQLRDRTAIFLGQSGVGKSQTISSLGGEKIELRTSAIGKGGKGSHTTTWAEIVDCHLFTLIDSPGVRSFSLDDLLIENFIEYFPDLEEIATHCKFRDCSHEENAVGCAFYNIEDEHEADIVFSRLESYWRFLDEISHRPDWQKS